MGTKSVRLDESVYEEVKARKRDDETFSEAIERLIGETPLTSIAGILSEEEADEFREAVEDVDEVARSDVDGVVERFDDE